jgi:hypothetical protein
MAALTTSCAELEIDTPDGFLQLETSGQEIKATTPDDARLWVHQFVDRDLGTVEFWAEALSHDLVEGRGYRLEEELETRDAEGRPGAIGVYTTTVDGVVLGYLCALFVIEERPFLGDDYNLIRLAEFVAPKDAFDALRPEVEKALTTLKP